MESIIVKSLKNQLNSQGKKMIFHDPISWSECNVTYFHFKLEKWSFQPRLYEYCSKLNLAPENITDCWAGLQTYFKFHFF